MFRRFVLMGLACIILPACASTSLTNSWKDPGTTGPVSFDQILVVFMNSNESVRRIAEDALVRRVGPGRRIASYTIISQEEARATDNAADKLRAANFDGAIVMRVISRDQELSYSPGMTYPSHYGSFYGYYGYGWPSVYDPGYLRTDTVVTVETNVFSVTDDKLLWSGVSETFNPNDVAKAVNDVADAVSEELRQQGLL